MIIIASKASESSYVNIILNCSAQNKIHRLQMNVRIEALTHSIELGEGPHWDHEKGILYYINLYDSEVHSYEPATKEHKFIKIGK